MCCSNLNPDNTLISLTSQAFLIVKDCEEKVIGWKERIPYQSMKDKGYLMRQIFF